MKQVRARYVLGLTATPIRKDGHHPIILMQCGPIRYQVAAKNKIQQNQLTYQIKVRHTNFNVPENCAGISDIYAAMTADEMRNELILHDILNSLKENRSPLLLTERTQHLDM